MRCAAGGGHPFQAGRGHGSGALGGEGAHQSGNFVDKKKFEIREYSDDQYAEELERIEEAFVPLVRLCQERGVAMRIGTNHGSLSDRIMNRYGDTPRGMVESALEFARIARRWTITIFFFR
jgi:(E)-4-hydroxy-3-methylbut-2-enyl-diphosphate synthase